MQNCFSKHTDGCITDICMITPIFDTQRWGTARYFRAIYRVNHKRAVSTALLPSGYVVKPTPREVCRSVRFYVVLMKDHNNDNVMQDELGCLPFHHHRSSVPAHLRRFRDKIATWRGCLLFNFSFCNQCPQGFVEFNPDENLAEYKPTEAHKSAHPIQEPPFCSVAVIRCYLRKYYMLPGYYMWLI